MRLSMQWCLLGAKGGREGGRHHVIVLYSTGTSGDLFSKFVLWSKWNSSNGGLRGWSNSNALDEIFLRKPVVAGPTLCNPSCFSVMCRHKCPSAPRIVIVVIGYRSLSPSSSPFLRRKSPRRLAKGFPRSLNDPHCLISPLKTIYTPPPLSHPRGSCVGSLYFDKKET